MDVNILLELIQTELSKAVSTAVEAITVALGSEAEDPAQDVAASADGGVQKCDADTVQPAKQTEKAAEDTLSKEDVAKMINESVPDAVTKAIEPLLKSVGVASNLNGVKPAEKADPDVWDGYYV